MIAPPPTVVSFLSGCWLGIALALGDVHVLVPVLAPDGLGGLVAHIFLVFSCVRVPESLRSRPTIPVPTLNPLLGGVPSSEVTAVPLARPPVAAILDQI